jgi:methyl coenzyme M reductase beta subunit
VTVVKKGAFGKSGKLDTRVLFAVVGDQHVSMAGKSHDQGSGGTVGVVVAAVLLWPVMPFVTGKSAEFPAGTTMNGYVENDLPIAFAAAPVIAPLVIPVAVPAAITPAVATTISARVN